MFDAAKFSCNEVFRLRSFYHNLYFIYRSCWLHWFTFIKTKSSKNWSLINIHSKVTTTIVVHHNDKQTLKIGEIVSKNQRNTNSDGTESATKSLKKTTLKDYIDMVKEDILLQLTQIPKVFLDDVLSGTTYSWLVCLCAL